MAKHNTTLFEHSGSTLWLHNNSIQKFLKTKHLDNKTLQYPHSDVFATAKKHQYLDMVSEKDRKIFGKFCRHWHIVKGEVAKNRLTKIKNMLNYYAVKQHNYKCKQRRLETRQA